MSTSGRHPGVPGVILSLLATVGSIVIGISLLIERLHLGLALVLSLISVTATFIVGAFSPLIARRIRLIASNKRQVFLSYDKSSASEGESIGRLLADAGATVWIGREMIKPGDSITAVIRKAIEESDRFVVVLSDAPSAWQSKELALAKANRLKIIPVLVHGAQVPEALSDIQAINLGEEREAGLRELLQATA